MTLPLACASFTSGPRRRNRRRSACAAGAASNGTVGTPTSRRQKASGSSSSPQPTIRPRPMPSRLQSRCFRRRCEKRVTSSCTAPSHPGCCRISSELVDAWHCWLPERYARVRVVADSVAQPGPPLEGAVAAFSGGVDSTFTLWRHAARSSSDGRRTIALAVLIHGLDIPLDDETAFRIAFARAGRAAADVWHSSLARPHELPSDGAGRMGDELRCRARLVPSPLQGPVRRRPDSRARSRTTTCCCPQVPIPSPIRSCPETGSRSSMTVRPSAAP